MKWKKKEAHLTTQTSYEILTDSFYFTLHNFSDIYGKVILTWAAFSFVFTLVQVCTQDTQLFAL